MGRLTVPGVAGKKTWIIKFQETKGLSAMPFAPEQNKQSRSHAG